MDIVLDTNILVGAINNDANYRLDASQAYSKFLLDANMKLAFDIKGEIKQEYDDNLRNIRKYQLEYQHLCQQQRIVYYSSNIPVRVKQHLLSIGFHEEEDHVFFGVAYNSDKIIVTNDSDYGVTNDEDKIVVAEYMQETGLKVFSAQTFVNSTRL